MENGAHTGWAGLRLGRLVRWGMPALVISLVLGAESPGAQAAERPPNVVIIISDDQGWGDLSLHGNKNIRTPNLDALAEAGARFDHFFVSPLCAPTRASLLTGRYHLRTGVTGVTRGAERLNLDEVTLSELFQSAGYATGAFGKWHNGSQYPYHPNGREFDEFYGFCCGHWANYFDTLMDHNGREVRGQGYISDDITDKALAFIAANQAQPFFCFIAYNTPHTPFQVPDEYFDRVERRGLSMFHRDRTREKPVETICALAMCENIDDNVGRVLKELDRIGAATDTIVMYLSDNGPNGWRWNGGMKGRKGSVDEGGVRSPLFIRWPGRIQPGTRIKPIASHIDVLPTLVELCGIDLASAPRQPKPLDGRSLKPLLVGRGASWPDRMIFSVQRGRMSVRTERFRADQQSLFDIRSDPGQRENIAEKHPEIHARLAEAIRHWHQEVTVNLPPARPFPVGHVDAPLTVLPAQDCQFHGEGLRFSAPPPNASWLDGWTSPSAFPAWDIDVLASGRYEVVLRYTCAPDAVGTELALSFGHETLHGRLGEAYDPELLPSPDRTKRGESYEKPFGRLALGEIQLTEGRGLLALKALTKRGREVMDLRAIELRRQ